MLKIKNHVRTHNVEIKIEGHSTGPQTFLFELDKSALDFNQQAGNYRIVHTIFLSKYLVFIINCYLGPNNFLPTVIEFLTNCVTQGVIKLNIEDLYIKNVKISILIPER